MRLSGRLGEITRYRPNTLPSEVAWSSRRSPKHGLGWREQPSLSNIGGTSRRIRFEFLAGARASLRKSPIRAESLALDEFPRMPCIQGFARTCGPFITEGNLIRLYSRLLERSRSMCG